MPLKTTCFMLLFSLYRSALTAAPLSSPSLKMVNVSDPSKDTLLNVPLILNPQPNARPQDPLEITSDWDGPGFITLTLSHYGTDIPQPLALHCISLALDDAWNHHPYFWNRAIGKSELAYTDTHAPMFVHLSVLPQAAMTWKMLYYAMRVVGRFTRGSGSLAFEYEYEVEVTGVQGLVATGNLSIFAEPGS